MEFKVGENVKQSNGQFKYSHTKNQCEFYKIIGDQEQSNTKSTIVKVDLDHKLQNRLIFSINDKLTNVVDLQDGEIIMAMFPNSNSFSFYMLTLTRKKTCKLRKIDLSIGLKNDSIVDSILSFFNLECQKMVIATVSSNITLRTGCSNISILHISFNSTLGDTFFINLKENDDVFYFCL